MKGLFGNKTQTAAPAAAPIIQTVASPAAPVDPLIEQQRLAAQEDSIAAIRSRLGFSTAQLIQRYGARQALLGGTQRPPIFGF